MTVPPCLQEGINMIKTTVQVTGMVCGMCEAHINDAVRSAFQVRKVRSSRKKGETVILSETSIDLNRLRQVIAETGYIMLLAHEEEA